MKTFMNATQFAEMTKNLFDISNVINWEEAGNGTGYYDNLMLTSLPYGDLATAVSPNGRRILFIGHGDMSSLIFERYTPGTGSPFILVGNIVDKVHSFTRASGGKMDDESIKSIMAFREDHITDKVILDKVVDELIYKCETSTNIDDVAINDKFWVREYAPWRLDTFSTIFSNFEEKCYTVMRANRK